MVLTKYLRVIMLALMCLMLLPGLALAATHVVSPGESLYQISKKYGVSVSSIKSANGLSSNTVYVGQRLKINDVYYVKRGDSLYLIGKKFGVSAQKIISANGLKSTGIYPGQQLTIPAVGGGYTAGTAAASSTSRGTVQAGISRSDFDLLARIITAEADSESFTAKVAVGAVILNRIESEKFPNSIPAVVYQVANGRYQFEPVLNGWINRPASESAKKAAENALNGWDPSYGALYFFEKDVTNKYLRSLPVTIVIDSFIFAR